MGASRIAWRSRWLAPTASLVLSLALSSSGCSLDELPTCGALELASTQSRAATAVEGDEVVMAISHVELDDQGEPTNQLTILRGDLDRLNLEIQHRPDQILLTGSSRWLTYVANHDLHRIDLHAELPAPTEVAIEFDRMELLGSLRGGDWILARTWPDGVGPVPATHDSDLVARYVGDDASFPFELEAKTIPIDDGEFRVAALGHRNIVVRKSLGNDQEALYLVRIAPSFRSDEHGSAQIGETLLLARGPSFSRVVLTSGQTPAELGDHDAFPNLPNDMLVIASSGSVGSPTLRTVVYDIRDLSLVGNFEGAVATSLVPLHDVPGLSALAPDNTHLAYVTQHGALALRNLASQTSCELRSGTGHVLAGFANDGTLYFQSREDDVLDDPDPRIREFDRVFAYDPGASATQAITLLSESPYRLPLRAVPDHHLEGQPWAIFGSETSGVRAARFLSPGQSLADPAGPSLWMLGSASTSADSEVSSEYELTLRGLSDSEAGDAEPLYQLPYTAQNRVCVSIAQTNQSAPWAAKCSDDSHFLSDRPPARELKY